MTITVTETPRLHSSERSTWQALVDQLEPNDLVVPGQRVTNHLKDHEVDFVVAIEGAGIVCLEVKGGEVWHDGEGWWQIRGGREKSIEPVRQAREACYALRDFIEKNPRWTQGRLRRTTSSSCPTPSCPRTSACPSARVGRSSTAPICRTSSPGCAKSSSARSSTACSCRLEASSNSRRR
ncbi:hypothetical protein TUM20985_27830 [Mycobacterium antarcticum]|nr:hypothetical protein TUM20985_27830 [Mycolicibacterium sp. TUM20985]GLP84207.1 hypothetical protein TUM20984_56270 [Mycolicibacterium sp. TUM20984]